MGAARRTGGHRHRAAVGDWLTFAPLARDVAAIGHPHRSSGRKLGTLVRRLGRHGRRSRPEGAVDMDWTYRAGRGCRGGTRFIPCSDGSAPRRLSAGAILGGHPAGRCRLVLSSTGRPPDGCAIPHGRASSRPTLPKCFCPSGNERWGSRASLAPVVFDNFQECIVIALNVHPLEVERCSTVNNVDFGEGA